MANARTIKKRMMKNRLLSFWGQRSYVTVRLPISLFPPPPPDYPTPLSLYPDDPVQSLKAKGWEQGFVGHWHREVPVSQLTERERADWEPGDLDNVVLIKERWGISKISCGDDPRKDYPDGGHGIEERHIIFNKEPYTDKNGETYHSCAWWEGVFTCVALESLDEKVKREDVQRFGIAPEIIDQYIARREWEDKYLVGMEGETGIPVLDAFLDAASYAKTTYPRIEGSYVYLTYSVKWFYPYYRARFSADLHRAFRVAKKHGVVVKLMR